MIQDSSLLDWKNLRDDEIEMLVDLSSLLSLNLFQRVTMILSSGWFDSKVVFSVIFFYNALGESLMASSGFVYLWKIPTPPGMLHFTWTAVLAGILTRAHLKKFIRKKNLMEMLIMCLQRLDKVKHLFIYCYNAQVQIRVRTRIWGYTILQF